MNRDIVFTIVTPTFNSEKFIAETIESVVCQSGDFSIEYIIVDNCSSDKTGELVRSYQKGLKSGVWPLNCNNMKIVYISENDSGMYDAINKGFSFATGDIFAWLNSDDIYLNGCLNGIAKIFTECSGVSWVKGITSYINKDSIIYSIGKCNLYYKEWIIQGLYGPVLEFIQQDSVFWRKEIWEAANGLNTNLRLAGDFDLWRRFAKISPLYSYNAYVSCFRKVDNQKSENINDYWMEISDIEDIQTSNKNLGKRVKNFKTKRKSIFGTKIFKTEHKHTYHLICIDSDGKLKIYDGDLDELLGYL